MSTPAPLNETRQQIDELDALLERMLALPVSDPEVVLPPVATPPKPDNERPRPAPTTALLTAPVATPQFSAPASEAPKGGRRRFLLGVNQIFDAATGPLGPFGGWLRGRPGRACLGWIGLTLLAGAIALLAFDVVRWSR